MITARLDIRLDREMKIKAEKASALLGLKSLTEYVVGLIDENATQVIAQHESITVKNDIFDQFMDACHKTRQPNNALINAASFSRDQGFK